MNFKIFCLLISMAFQAFALKLSDYSPYEYKVFFTNPECQEYQYEQTVYAIDGTALVAKPKNVYCKRQDFERNSIKESSPHFQIKKLISDPEVKSLFLSFLSFSNREVAYKICGAIQRNVKVTFVIDSKSEKRPRSREMLDFISECRPQRMGAGESYNKPVTIFRGNTDGIGYAHNKIIIAKYKDPNKVRLVYGSGNMSSGTTLHHENWHFVTTSKDTYLAQSHMCVKQAMIDSGDSRSKYKKTFMSCRDQIEVSEEDDIKMMVVPSDGKRAMANIVDNFKKAISIDVAAHRFTHPELVNAMIDASKEGKQTRFIADDDIYWTGVRKKKTGSNMYMEYVNTIKVVRAGVNTRYMETNQNHRLLHHNKYVLFNYADGSGAVHAGAGNFTKAAFTKNMENYYFITIAEVVDSFRKQYDYSFEKLATHYEKMPSEYVMP
ncbi:MAG: hypothetical protein KC478_15975 [Bacteriovoracaceae bacterium]|nr:hypothetical protein [Bacteriovoracaceae bacterium]